MATFCAFYDQHRCRSCAWIEREYSRQLQAKERSILEALAFTGLMGLEKSVPSPPQGFRNRAKLNVSGTAAQPIIGLLGPEDDLDAGRELLECPIHHPRINEVLAALPPLLSKHGVVPYRIRERDGELKGLILFHSPATDQMYLRFVVRTEAALPALRPLTAELQARFPFLVCVSMNLQPIPHAILEGPEEVFLTERKFIDHRLGEHEFRLAPQAFVQTNVQVATALYETAARWVAEIGPRRMMELFCGQGAFSFFCAKSAEKILGIEINADAVRAASETAAARGLNHLTFKQADATRVDAEIAGFRPDLLLVNPPRKGLGRGIEQVRRHLPAHLIYSSCSLDSLAADLRQLQGSYRLRRAQLFDMFPHTEHFEILTWLERSVPSIETTATRAGSRTS